LINIETGFRKFWWISWISIFRPTALLVYCVEKVSTLHCVERVSDVRSVIKRSIIDHRSQS